MITFLRFGRAHTLIGTTLSLLALYLIATRHTGATDWGMFAYSLFICLAANVFITGLNQLTDVAIDRINKPYLPLASGAYSMRTGRMIVTISGLLAVCGCLIYQPYFMATVLASVGLGIAYSLEPLRLKRFHFWAAFCIIVVRGLIVNLGLYLHFAGELSLIGASPQVQGSIVLLTSIVFVFGVIIAWFKDLPDTEGDDEYGIRTLTLARSPEWVYRTGALLLGVTLLTASGYALYREWTGLAACLVLLLFGFAFNARLLNLASKKSIAKFYQGTWLVFFGIYLAFAIYG